MRIQIDQWRIRLSVQKKSQPLRLLLEELARRLFFELNARAYAPRSPPSLEENEEEYYSVLDLPFAAEGRFLAPAKRLALAQEIVQIGVEQELTPSRRRELMIETSPLRIDPPSIRKQRCDFLQGEGLIVGKPPVFLQENRVDLPAHLDVKHYLASVTLGGPYGLERQFLKAENDRVYWKSANNIQHVSKGLMLHYKLLEPGVYEAGFASKSRSKWTRDMLWFRYDHGLVQDWTPQRSEAEIWLREKS